MENLKSFGTDWASYVEKCEHVSTLFCGELAVVVYGNDKGLLLNLLGNS